jgi:hypothetical protein
MSQSFVAPCRLALIHAAAAGVFFLLGVSFARAALPEDWASYRNERFGFSLRYPAGIFAKDRAAEAGDGELFVARNTDARLLVGALVNDSGFTPATYLDHIARRSYPQYQIDYRRLVGNWFVLSGEANGRIFYEKVMFSCAGRLINSFAVIYPTDQRRDFDRIVEGIEATFRPGVECQQAGLSATDMRPPTRSAAPRPAGERSAVADRIARSRGHDVIVVLRRTTPPYDRKIVRGYNSRP